MNRSLRDKCTGKMVTIESASIRIAANSRIACGYYAEVRMHAVLPGCRKARVISITPMPGGVWLKPLWASSGEAHVDPDEWERFVASLPVREDRVSPITITQEMDRDCRKRLGYDMAESVRRQGREAAEFRQACRRR